MAGAIELPTRHKNPTFTNTLLTKLNHYRRLYINATGTVDVADSAGTWLTYSVVPGSRIDGEIYGVRAGSTGAPIANTDINAWYG